MTNLPTAPRPGARIMTDTQACSKCCEPKPLSAFEQLSSGNYRGTCKACRTAASSARRSGWHSVDQYRQHIAQVAREAAERLANAKAEREAKDEAEREARRRARRDVFFSMYIERHKRAVGAVRRRPEGIHQLPLKQGGFISVVEFAMRVEELQAATRAAGIRYREGDYQPLPSGWTGVDLTEADKEQLLDKLEAEYAVDPFDLAA